MLLNNKIQYSILAIVAIILFGFVGYNVQSNAARISRIDACSTVYKGEAAQINCWQEIMREEFDKGGTREAFEIFEIVYKNYEVFANTGCHRHAHRVGDMAYYFDYLTHKDFTKMNFPKGATACGYGFYHGFFEHLIQDHPDIDFVTKTCEYMRNNLEEVAPAISQTCYHGSGHGFILARSDELIRESQWSLSALVDIPLNQCESLPKASEREISECRQGVYNVIVDWMADEEYGLSYDRESPFAVCDTQPYGRQKDCYYEMAQKLDSVSDFDPQKMVSIVEKAARVDLRPISISVGVAGIVQRNPQGDQTDLLKACQRIDITELRHKCIFGILGGLVEHAIPGSDYKNAINFCEAQLLAEDERQKCYKELLNKLKRFRTNEEVQKMCTKGALTKEFCVQGEKRIWQST